jgi:Uma2 family endonuclease
MINSAFVSVETFEFERLIELRPPSDPNSYELSDGRIVMTPFPGWPHGIYEARFVTAVRMASDSSRNHITGLPGVREANGASWSHPMSP